MGVPSKGRKAVLVTLLALIAVLAAASPEFVAEYHAWRLRRTPALLVEAVEAPADSGLDRGLRRFLGTKDGRTALLDRFLGDFLQGRRASGQDLAQFSEFKISLAHDSTTSVSWRTRLGGAGRRAASPAHPWRKTPPTPTLEKMAGRLAALEGAEIRSAAHRGWTFEVRTEKNDGKNPGLLLVGRRSPHESPEDLGLMLRGGSPEARLDAALNLCALGARAEPAMLDLAEALRTGPEEVRVAAIQALAQIGPPALAVLFDLSRDQDSEVRSAAIISLQWTEKTCEAAVARLRGLQSDADPAIRAWASALLGKLDA